MKYYSFCHWFGWLNFACWTIEVYSFFIYLSCPLFCSFWNSAMLLKPLYSYFSIFYNLRFILINYLNELISLPVPFYFVELPLSNLIPQLLYLFSMRVNILLNFFLPKALFLKFLNKWIFNLFKSFSLLHYRIYTLTDIFHLVLQADCLLFLLEYRLELFLIIRKLLIMFLLHWLNQI